jgi:uncharacterized membrane protein YfcA
MSFFVPIIAGFLSGLIGSMGFGGGGVLIIYLVLFTNTPQITTQGTNLIFFIPCATLATVIYFTKKEIKIKSIIPVISGGITGSIIASNFLNFFKSEQLSHIFGVFLISIGLYSIFNQIKVGKNV